MMSLNRRILRLGIPSTIASLSVPLIGIVDTALIGHLPEVAYLGAVAVASVIFDVIYWGFGFLRMGTTGLTAQHFGANQRAACTRVLVQTCLLGAVIGILIVLLRGVLEDVGFGLAGGSEDVQYWGREYFRVRIYAVPVILVTLALTGFLRGISDAITPMWITVIVNIVNVVGDYTLIYGKLGAPALGVVGAAWASVLASVAGLAYACLVLLLKYRSFLIERPLALLEAKGLRLLFTTNMNLFFRTACLLFAQFFLLITVSRMGEVALAANAVLWQVWSLVSFSVDGFAHSAETLVGNDLGARDFDGARRVARRCLVWGGWIGIGYALVYALGMESILSTLTTHEAVVAEALALVWLVAWIQPLNGLVFILDGIFIGANDTGYLFLAMLISAFAIYLPATLLCVHVLQLGLFGAWLGYNGLMIGRFATLLVRYRGRSWMRTFAT